MITSGELSPLDQEIAMALRSTQPDYRFEPTENYSAVSEKIMVGTQGPIGSQKSLLRRTVIERAPEFSQFGIRTTRHRKPTDLDNFLTAENGITHTSINQDIIQKRLVDFSVSHKGHITGSTPDDIGRYAIGKIHPESIDNLIGAEFKAFYAVFVLSRGALYQQVLRQKIADSSPLIARQQIVSALESINSAQRNHDLSQMLFVDLGQSPEELHEAADAVTRTVYQSTRPIMTQHHIVTVLDEMKQAVQTVGSELGLK